MNIKGPLPPGNIDTVKPVATIAQTGVRPQVSPQGAISDRAIQALLQVGQLLNAVVLKATDSGALLQVESPLGKQDGPQLRLWTQPPVPLKVGQQVAMEVEQVAGQQPRLRLLSPVNEARQLLNQQLASAQSRQQTLPPLLANIRHLNSTPPAAGSERAVPLNSDVLDRVQTLWRQIPERAQLTTATALKQAMKNTGPFLEATLAQIGRGERAFPAMDLRAGLLRLAATLRSQLSHANPNTSRPSTNTPLQPAARVLTATPTSGNTNADPASGARSSAATEPTPGQPQPPTAPQPQARHNPTVTQLTQSQQVLEELSAQVEGALARIQTHQLQSLTSDAQRPVWHLELPVRDEQQIDLFDLRIQRDGGRDGDEGEAQHRWSVMLAFDLEGLGALRVQVQLQGERIATHWWAEQNETSELFARYKAVLENRLNGAGLAVDQIDCRCGTPKFKESAPSAKPPHRIDQKV